jgi:tryptophan halogenase
MTDKKTKNVLVVGGGTAGWIAASYLAKKLGSHQENSVKVTVIESPDIDTIGVGEGTFPTIKSTLKFLGISETDFIKKADATFKQAIKFSNWLYNPGETNHRNYYYHLFDTPTGSPNFDISPHWLINNAVNKAPFDETVSIQTIFCDNNLAPKKITTKEYDGLNYAYHLDAVKFAKFLREYAVNSLGVTHLTGTVTDVKLAEDGFISSVMSKECGEISADLFIDCTGFKSLLIGETYNIDFEDTSDILFCDNAVTMQVPYDDMNAPIMTHTISTAQPAGWTWDIGLTKRRGVGYVYSSKHSSRQEAEQLLRNYVGKKSEQLTTRHIPIKTGYRIKQWHKNCVALGLSAGFIEPLESTALAMIELATKFLSDEFPYSKKAMPIIEKKFNDVFIYRWQAIVDFVKLHYVISKRDDSKFWLDNRETSSIPASLQAKLEKWSMSPPTRNDFPSIYDIFGLESHQYVLYGMDFCPDISHQKSAIMVNEKLANHYLEQVSKQGKQTAPLMQKNRDLINKVYQYGLKKI